MKKGGLIVLIVLACWWIAEGVYWVKDGFTPRRIQGLNIRMLKGWEAEAQGAIQQPFHYIGRGRQCFAFESEDGKYVLKIPRTDIYKTPFWARVLPCFSYRKKLEAKHEKRERFIIESFRISFDELQDQTGVLAIHFGITPGSGQMVTLIDASGWKHRVSLDRLSFALQYKQPILTDVFLSALAKEDREQAKKILDALMAAIIERASKGILNLDPKFIRNYGYDGERAFQIDIGSFFTRKDLPQDAAAQKSVRDSIDPIREWLTRLDPEMCDYLNFKVADALDSTVRRTNPA